MSDALLQSAAEVAVNGARLAYVEHGGGEPVVFVHGGISDLRTWTHQLSEVGTTHRAIAYSCRYAVPNPAIDAAAPAYWPTQVQDLVALLPALDAAPAHLVGNSSGAFVCLLAAVARPDLVRSLILEEPPVLSLYVGTPPRPGELLPLLLRHPRTALGIVRFGTGTMVQARKASLAGDDEKALRIFVKGVLANRTLDDVAPERQRQMRENFGWLKHVLVTGEEFPRIDPDAVRRFTKPVLLITGAHSPSFLRRLTDRLEELFPNVRRVEIEGASHLMHEENPGATNHAIADFLADDKRER